MIRPLGKNVLIEKKEKETKTSFGLVLADDGKKKEEGLVKAVGSEVKEIKIGDYVLLKAWGTEKVEFEGQELYLTEENQILAIIV